LEEHKEVSRFAPFFGRLKIDLLKKIGIGLFFMFLSIYDFLIFFIKSGINVNTDASFESMINGTASKPFVYRMLVPALLRGINHITPQSFSEFISVRLTKFFPLFPEYYHISSDIVYIGLCSVIIILLSLFCYSIVLYLGALNILSLSRGQAIIAPLIGLLMLHPFFDMGYIYDLPQLALSSACLYLMSQQKWVLYFVFFILLCLNKETSIIMIFAYVCNYYDKHKFMRLSYFTMIQFLIYIAIRLCIVTFYSHNSGDMVQVFIVDQYKSLINGFSYESFALSILFVFILSYSWFRKPSFLRRSLILVAPLLILFFLGGFPGEYRVFYEVLYIITLLISHSIVTAWKN
jgi:hypothetical protein